MGYASYQGPWGMSLNTPTTGTLYFTKSSYNYYYLKVETSTNNNQDSYSASIGCPSPTPQVSITAIQDPNISTIMSNSFQSLQVNLPELSTELGLSSTLSANDIDFVNLYKSYPSNSYDTGYAITAPFKNNSNYGYVLYSDGTNYIRPMIVRATSTQIIYFDLSNDLTTTITNFKSTSFTTSQLYGNYMARANDCGQATLNCVIDSYSNHGWASVWNWVQSGFYPETIAAIAAACAIKNCIHKS